MHTRPTSTRTSTPSAAISTSALEISLAAGASRAQRREVRRHSEDAERKRRPRLAGATRVPVVGFLATRRPGPAPSRDENENSQVDQDQAENEVERRVEVRLGRE